MAPPSPAAATSPPCSQRHGERSTATCTGCGAFLCPSCPGDDAPPRCAACRTGSDGVPWERPDAGTVRGFLATLAALAKPDRFFALPALGGLRAPLGFAALAATVGALLESLISLASNAVFLSWAVGMANSAAANPQFMRRASPAVRALLADVDGLAARLAALLAGADLVKVALAPVSAVLGALVLAALSHPIARALGGRGPFEATVRVVGYAAAAEVFAPVPGAPLILGLLLATVGFRRTHGLSTGRALVAAGWWVPVGVLAGAIAAAGVAAWLFTTVG